MNMMKKMMVAALACALFNNVALADNRPMQAQVAVAKAHVAVAKAQVAAAKAQAVAVQKFVKAKHEKEQRKVRHDFFAKRKNVHHHDNRHHAKQHRANEKVVKVLVVRR